MSYPTHKPSSELSDLASRPIPSPAPTYTSTAPRIYSSSGLQASNYDPKYTDRRERTSSYTPAANERDWTLPRHNGPTSQESQTVMTPDYRDQNYPQYAQSTVPDHPKVPPRWRRLPKKAMLVPWILAGVFFLTTLWYTSILIGARFFSTLFHHPTYPILPEIKVFINGEGLHGAVSATTNIHSAAQTIGSADTKTMPPSSRRSVVSIPVVTASTVPPSDNSGNNQGITLLLSEDSRPAPTGRETDVEERKK